MTGRMTGRVFRMTPVGHIRSLQSCCRSNCAYMKAAHVVFSLHPRVTGVAALSTLTLRVWPLYLRSPAPACMRPSPCLQHTCMRPSFCLQPACMRPSPCLQPACMRHPAYSLRACMRPSPCLQPACMRPSAKGPGVTIGGILGWNAFHPE